jgi:hypothetical protein
MLIFNDIGFDQLPKFDVPARFLPTTSVGIESTVPAQAIGPNSSTAPTSSANNTLLYVFIGGIAIIAGYTIFLATKDSKNKKTKKTNL